MFNLLAVMLNVLEFRIFRPCF